MNKVEMMFEQAVIAAEVAILLREKMIEKVGNAENINEKVLNNFLIKKVSNMNINELLILKKVLSM